MPPHNIVNADSFLTGDDVQVGLVTDLRPESVIQRLYFSGGNKLLTMTIPKSWCYRMALHRGDYIFMELSADATEFKVKKVSTQKFKDNNGAQAVVPIDGDKAAAIIEQEENQKAESIEQK